MIRGFQEFHNWLLAHNIDPDHIEVVIECKTIDAASKLRLHLNRDFGKYSLRPASEPLPLDCGQINGLVFRI